MWYFLPSNGDRNIGTDGWSKKKKRRIISSSQMSLSSWGTSSTLKTVPRVNGGGGLIGSGKRGMRWNSHRSPGSREEGFLWHPTVQWYSSSRSLGLFPSNLKVLFSLGWISSSTRIQFTHHLWPLVNLVNSDWCLFYSYLFLDLWRRWNVLIGGRRGLLPGTEVSFPVFLTEPETTRLLDQV